MLLDYHLPALRYLPANTTPVEIPLAGHSQRSLLAALFEQIAEPELAPLLPAGGSIEDRLLRAYELNQIRAAPKAQALLAEEPLEVDQRFGGLRRRAVQDLHDPGALPRPAAGHAVAAGAVAGTLRSIHDLVSRQPARRE